MGRGQFLVDCGEPVTRALTQHGIAPAQIQAILLTHLHADHLGGFLMLIQSMWLQGRETTLRLMVPEAGAQPLQCLLDAALLLDEMRGFGLEWNVWKEAEPITIGDSKVTPYRTSHLDSLRHLARARDSRLFDAFAFRIESPAGSVGHSGDLGRPEDLDPLLSKPLDLLVCELAHFTPESLFDYLSGKPVRRLVLTHVARHFWESGMDRVTQAAADRLGGMDFEIAVDGAEFRI